MTTAPVEPDLTRFEGRYPEPDEICRYGGLPGVEYCYVAGQNQRKFVDMGFSPITGVPALPFIGPLGTMDTVVVMGRGAPIQGAGDDNGIRRWFVDVDVEGTIGIPANPDSPVGKPTEAIRQAAKPAKGDIQVIEGK
ncbi:MAG: hypothetical protein A2139_02400 [Desulfobacca sp. RBG_16_60_12]|nr:MAG: hypothetical protein A2139_02400 [Desulfobacca sp. RBG_16_60_12]